MAETNEPDPRDDMARLMRIRDSLNYISGSAQSRGGSGPVNLSDEDKTVVASVMKDPDMRPALQSCLEAVASMQDRQMSPKEEAFVEVLSFLADEVDARFNNAREAASPEKHALRTRELAQFVRTNAPICATWETELRDPSVTSFTRPAQMQIDAYENYEPVYEDGKLKLEFDGSTTVITNEEVLGAIKENAEGPTPISEDDEAQNERIRRAAESPGHQRKYPGMPDDLFTPAPTPQQTSAQSVASRVERLNALSQAQQPEPGAEGPRKSHQLGERVSRLVQFYESAGADTNAVREQQRRTAQPTKEAGGMSH